MAEALANETTQTDLTAPARASRFSKGTRAAAWTALFLFALIVFTIAKLPSVRIKNFVQGSIASVLAQRGISFNAGQGYISLGFGISYVMKDVTLGLPPPDEPVKIDKITVSPSFSSLLFGRMGGDIDIRNGDGKLLISFAGRSNSMTGSFSASDFDLGKVGLFPMLASFKAGALLGGSGSFKGDPNNLADLSGDLDLDLKKIVIDQQNLMGFALPRIGVSEGKAQATASGGKLVIKSLTLGKKGSVTEDIAADVTGDVGLAKFVDSMALNLGAKFNVSQTVIKAFPLIDAFLGPGKQPDGTFAYKVTGTVGIPVAVPAGK